MNAEVKNLLEEFKEYTAELISCLEKEDYDSLEHFINRRQLVLDKLENLDYDKIQLASELNELELERCQKVLNDFMISKRDGLLDNISKLAKSKNANNKYNKNVIGSVVFSKKI